MRSYINNFRLLRQAVFTCLLLLLSPFAVFARPNVVVIMIDDLDLASSQYLVANGYMPYLNTYVIQRGSTFSNFFVTTSNCCPSRASFLTGQYSHNNGVLNSDPPKGGVSVFNDANTLPVWLKSAGYRTALIGKYLNGYGNTDSNRDGVRNVADMTYIPPGWDNFQALVDPYTGRMYNYVINDNGLLKPAGATEQEYQTDALALRAVKFIDDTRKNQSASPFFLYVAPVAPHQEFVPGVDRFETYTDIWRISIRPPRRYAGTINRTLPQGPAFNEADLTDKPSWLQSRPALTPADITAAGKLYRDRLEATRGVDDLIGAVVSALVRNGVMQNTVLIVTSDNGFLMGEHRLPQKLAPYEESIRVPLYVNVPGFASRQTLSQYVLNVDLAPTIAHLAGVQPGRQTDGVSMVPVMQKPGTRWRQRFLIEHARGNVGSYDIPDFAAVRTDPAAAGTPNELYVEYDNQGVKELEFYDLNLDPSQLTSLHNDASESRTQERLALSQYLQLLRTCKGRGCSAVEF